VDAGQAAPCLTTRYSAQERMRGTIMAEVRELARQATQVAMVLAGCILALGMAWNLFQGIIS
jgi:hypothetical protein